MKLAAALSERADLQCRITDLSDRLKRNARTQQGESPAENPADLLSELDTDMTRLEELMTRINLTNSTVRIDGKTLTELIAHRDCLRKKLSVLRDFLQEASAKTERYSRTEILVVSTVDVPALQKQVDALSREVRLTDECLQQANWTVDLL